MRTLTEQVISFTSRPRAAQCPVSTSFSSSHCSGLSAMAFHCWAQRATVRSVRFLPRPPIVTGGCGCWTGFGSHLASVSLTYFFFFQAEDGIRDYKVTGVQTCALPISAERGIMGHAPDPADQR